jgi:hypothetical protein
MVSGTLAEFLEMSCDYHLGVVTSTPQPDNPDPCTTLGDLSRINSSGELCELANGRYITKEDNLQDDIQCLLQTGTGPWDGMERPIEAMFEAFAPARTDPGGCNEGFLRDDASLLVVVVSSSDDKLSAGLPADWYDQLVLQKGGRRENVSIIEIVDTMGPPNGCTAEEAKNLEDFGTEALPTHLAITDLCDPDQIDDDIENAINTVGPTACQDFIPP